MKDHVVYFITDGSDKVKIGRTSSKNPNERLKALQTGSPNELYFIGIDEEGLSETQYHERFSHLRVRDWSEWFYIKNDLEEFLFNEFDYLSPSLPCAVFLDEKGRPEYQMVVRVDTGYFLRGVLLNFVTGIKDSEKRFPKTKPHLIFESTTKMVDLLQSYFDYHYGSKIPMEKWCRFDEF